jgi:Pvc16 N-terminal domain
VPFNFRHPSEQAGSAAGDTLIRRNGGFHRDLMRQASNSRATSSVTVLVSTSRAPSICTHHGRVVGVPRAGRPGREAPPTRRLAARTASWTSSLSFGSSRHLNEVSHAAARGRPVAINPLSSPTDDGRIKLLLRSTVGYSILPNFTGSATTSVVNDGSLYAKGEQIVLHELDQTLATLLKSELPGRDQVTISFAAPDDAFSVPLPAVDLFLYDIRENLELRSNDDFIEPRDDLQVARIRPPVRVDASVFLHRRGCRPRNRDTAARKLLCTNIGGAMAAAYGGLTLGVPGSAKPDLNYIRKHRLTTEPTAAEEIARQQLQEKQQEEEARQLMGRLLSRGIRLEPGADGLSVSPGSMLSEEDFRQLKRHAERITVFLKQVQTFATTKMT